MSSHFGNSHLKSQRLADLRNETEELERRLSDARLSLERELAQPAYSGQSAPGRAQVNGRQSASGRAQETCHCALQDAGREHDADPMSALYAALDPADDEESAVPWSEAQLWEHIAEGRADPSEEIPWGEAYPSEEIPGGPVHRSEGLFGGPVHRSEQIPGGQMHPPEQIPGGQMHPSGQIPGGQMHPSEERTEVLVSHGRRSAHQRGMPRGRKAVMGTKAAPVAAIVAVLVAVVVTILASGGASWPPSVATVQREAATACRNPDVKSEPGQVNFACAAATRQILWVFALLTSGNNPDFADGKTGRLGLEPITPAQGGAVAWSLNLHHPYDPANPIDSLAVAARAINNIIGGASVTGADGRLVVQSGLEGDPANCVRYTGSRAATTRKGFPALCARPVVSPAGQAALVADVYQKWVVGAGPKAAQDAAVLFANAENPGDPRVQAILKHLRNSRP